MKNAFLSLITTLLFVNTLFSQERVMDSSKIMLDKFQGTYRSKIDSLERFLIKKENGHLVLAITGQGKTDLSLIQGNTYKVKQVQPPARIEFIEDSSKIISKFLWHQDLNNSWAKVRDTAATAPVKRGELAEYAGKYQLTVYKAAIIRVANDHLTLEVIGDTKLEVSKIDLFYLSPDKFTFKNNEANQVFEFARNNKGVVEKLKVTRNGPIQFTRAVDATGDSSFAANFTNRENGFNRADSLHGMLTSLRTCYDVLFYALDVSVDPASRSIHGNTVIRFKTMESFDKMQVDLYANMKIEKILFHDQPLAYTRAYNAVFIQFPKTLMKGIEEEINFIYGGFPQTPDMATLNGGFFWAQDHNGKPWIESVCQGAGASLWWPCKDHLSDKPDSMKISITVPGGLTDISNGRLKAKTNLPGNLTRFDWYVGYPISTYDVAINIGDYTHFSDLYTSENDTLTLNYYCMPYNVDKAKKIFNHVKPMLALYEQRFSKYPFKNDGFTLLESLYPMEHQSAVTFGPINNPINSDRFDSTDLIRTAWHEAAHEWWGNNITCKDNADLWIHEAFATYTEVLCYEHFSGKDAALKYLKSEPPANKRPIIGVYDVNNFHLGDMYAKGALMLHTLRNTIDNDSLWFSILKGLQYDLRFHAVTTEDIVSYFNKSTNINLMPFFNQYLRHPAIPRLSLILKREEQTLQVQYKWDVDADVYEMPVKVTMAKNHFDFIHPTKKWQTINLTGMRYKDFKVDTDSFYISVIRQEL